MDKRTQYEYLKHFLERYRSGKRSDPMMIRLFSILLADLESEIISDYMRNKK
jgi:hypothetical protein